MTPDDDDSAIFILMNLSTWIYGTILQCDRLLAADANEGRDRQRSVIEEEFVVVAARKMVRWLEQAKKKKLVPQQSFKEVARLATVITDVRNMQEHADDYVVRKSGKKQSKFEHRSVTAEGLTYGADATGTIVFPGNYLIGGRLSVQLVLESATFSRQEFNAFVLTSDKYKWMALS